jgi:Ricin-type beta-trefoil lectin domain-like/F5/8 type C domain
MRLASGLSAAVLVLAGAATLPATATATASPPPPAVGAGTHFLDHHALLDHAGITDQSWFEANIPFLDVPDTAIQDVYYYRFHTWKEHLNYLDPADGYTSSEFLPDVGYNAPGGAIDAAAGHVIHDGRWVRDQSYLDDYENYWLTGPGAAHTHGAYTFWAASSFYDRYLVNGDAATLRADQQALVAQYDGWANQYDPGMGLYWTVPWEDAMEYDAASYETSEHFSGGAGFRSSINAYQWADAGAIARIATLNGDSATAADFTRRAAALRTAMQARLWDPDRQFFYHVQRDDNPGHAMLDTREVYGFFPWYFDMPDPADSAAWAQFTDPQGFAAAYGPTTTERRSRWFMNEAAQGCCRWDGPSWPYATSLVLGGLANLLDDYPAQPYVSRADYVGALQRFAATQYKDGHPYVAEAHDPDQPVWIYDTPGHSLDYNHSSYTDLVISGLLGVRPRADDTVVLEPLVPDSWDHFALENVPYHGHNLTVLYDRDGTHYGQGAGFAAYVDGVRVLSRPSVPTGSGVTVPVGATVASPRNGLVNIAANPARSGGGTVPTATYTSPYDDAWRAIDGRNTWVTDPNTRWTSYQSPNASDSYALDFGHAVSVDDVRLYFYDDGGGVRAPTSYALEYWTGSGWAAVPGQARSPAGPTGDAVNDVSFPALTTSRLRVTAPNRGGGVGWGLTEFEVWAQPVFFLVNANSGLLLAIRGASLDDGAPVQQFHDNGTRDHLWRLVPAGGGWYKIQNLNSGLLLGVTGMSTEDSASAVQYRDNGTADHLWQLLPTADGWFKVRNRNSGLLLGVDGMSTVDGASVVQYHDNGTTDHLWRLQPTT